MSEEVTAGEKSKTWREYFQDIIDEYVKVVPHQFLAKLEEFGDRTQKQFEAHTSAYQSLLESKLRGEKPFENIEVPPAEKD